MKRLVDLHQDPFWSEETKGQTSISQIANLPAGSIVIGATFPEIKVSEMDSVLYVEGVTKSIKRYYDHPNIRIIQDSNSMGSVVKNSIFQGVIIHVEGLYGFNGENSKLFLQLDKWFNMGMGSLALTWNKSNIFAGGADNPLRGLNKIGENVLYWVLEKHLIFDLAHASEQTFWDVNRIFPKPLFVSHAGARAIVDTPRNLTDTQIEAVAQSNGVIGVSFAKSFMYNKGNGAPFSFAHVMQHALHIAKVGGIDSLAIGTDLGGILSGLPGGLHNLATIDKFIYELYKEFNTEEVNKIMFSNSARVLSSHLSS